MAKARTEGRRGPGARANRKRSPAALAAAREQGQKLQAAGKAWRAAQTPEALHAVALRGAETRRLKREAEGIENLALLQALVRVDQLEFLKARAAACPCPFAELVRHALDLMIYSADDEEEEAA